MSFSSGLSSTLTPDGRLLTPELHAGRGGTGRSTGTSGGVVPIVAARAGPDHLAAAVPVERVRPVVLDTQGRHVGVLILGVPEPDLAYVWGFALLTFESWKKGAA